MKFNYLTGLLFCLMANVYHHGSQSKNLVFNIEQGQHLYLIDYYMQKEPDIKKNILYSDVYQFLF